MCALTNTIPDSGEADTNVRLGTLAHVTLDEYESDPWIHAFLPIPGDLLRIFGMRGSYRRFAILEAFAEELRLACPGASIPTLELFDALLEPVWAIASDGHALAAGRGLTVAELATRDMTLEDMITAMEELRWGDSLLKAVRVRDIESTVRKRLAYNLSHHVTRMLHRWVDNQFIHVARTS